MKICVIGAGFGGLAASSLLVQKGHEIHVYEKEKILGGRGLTLETNIPASNYKSLLNGFHMWVPFADPSLEEICGGLCDGYKIDLGFHLMGGGQNAAPARVLSSLGEPLNVLGSRIGFIGEKISYPYLSSSDKLRMIPRILQLLFSRKSTISALKDVSMAETIQKYGRGKMKLTLELFPRLITTVNDLSRISTGDTFFAQRELMGAQPVAYPIGGIGVIANRFGHYTQEKGGKIFTEPVDKVLIDNGCVKGVKVGNEEIFYDIVISNLPVQGISSIISDVDLPDVKYFKKLEGTGSLCSYHAFHDLPSHLIGKSFMFVEKGVDVEGGDAAGMIDFKMACPEAGTSPKGRYLVQSYIICSPDEAKRKNKMDLLRSIIDKYLEMLIPRFSKKMDWCLYPSIWQLDGVAKTIDHKKPSCVTSIKNLFLVGDCIDSSGVGVNCAVDSALRLLEVLERSDTFTS